MPHAVFFTREGHAIHGTNEVKRLGNPASHGCVRLSPQNAEMLFELVEETGLENTQIVLAGLTPGGEGRWASSAQSKPRYRVEFMSRPGSGVACSGVGSVVDKTPLLLGGGALGRACGF